MRETADFGPPFCFVGGVCRTDGISLNGV
ncbi:hypothetical protein CBM2585_B120212 [Cupriavidus taiwanensis]|nr:hypothetical protein CBM2585_B120212 [Cupriavidus taiwanensis]